MKRIVILAACSQLLLQGASYAHEAEKHPTGHRSQSGEGHATGHHEDARMKKLHEMMPMYAQAQARIIGALEKRDAAVVESEVGKILATIPDLKKSRPHKNLKEVSKLRKIAGDFEADIRATAASAKKGDFAGAGTAFSRAQKRCDACHAKFRD